MVYRLTWIALVLAVVFPGAGCLGTGMRLYGTSEFSEQLAIVSPHDEAGGRFDGAQISPGFGVLYRNGYTDEAAEREQCGGVLGELPEHVLELQQAMILKIVVQSSSDLVLGVVSPDGQLICWDESSISNANVSLDRSYTPGRYEVFVGSRERSTSSSYRLVLSE